MTKETLDAALLQLEASAKELMGIMKEMSTRPTQEGDSQAIANYAARLANIEGGYLTLKQYAPLILEHGTRTAPTAVEVEEEVEEEPNFLKPGVSKTADRVAEVRAATLADAEAEEE